MKPYTIATLSAIAAIAATFGWIKTEKELEAWINSHKTEYSHVADKWTLTCTPKDNMPMEDLNNCRLQIAGPDCQMIVHTDNDIEFHCPEGK